MIKHRFFKYGLFFFFIHGQFSVADDLRPVISISCQEQLEESFIAIKRDQEPIFPNEHQCKVDHRLVEWLWFKKKGGPLDKMINFIQENPEWPELKKIKRHIEQYLYEKGSVDQSLKYFSIHFPLTSEGAFIYAYALQQKNAPQKENIIKRLWIYTNFNPSNLESKYYNAFKDLLNGNDHQLRLNRLLIEGNFYGLQSMKQYVSKRAKKHIDHAIKLIQNKKKIWFEKDCTSPEYLKNPGMTVRILEWLLKNNKKEEASQLFLNSNPCILFKIYPENLLRYKNYFARNFFKNGEPLKAYDILFDNPVDPALLKDIVPYVESEFLKGFLGIYYKKNPQTSIKIFLSLYKMVKTPLSKARLAYWIGIANEHVLLKDYSKDAESQAVKWFTESAQHAHTFYGQLAAKRLKERYPHAPFSEKLVLLQEGSIPKSFSEFSFLEQQVMESLSKLDSRFKQEIEDIIFHFAKVGSKQLGETLVEMSHVYDLSHLAVRIAKWVGRTSPVLTYKSYPTIKFTDQIKNFPHVTEPFLLALIRQESNFDSQSISTAGAKGFMQLMIPTARDSAKDLGITITEKMLLNNPQLNLLLGSYHISKLLQIYEGNRILALACYNAGPKVNEWVKQWGIPSENDPERWIESIPFEETRSYVQRVLENVPLYERFLAGNRRPDNSVAVHTTE